MLPAVKSEGLSAALAFIKAPPQTREERVLVGRKIIDNVVNQVGIIREAAGFSNFALGGLIDMWKREELWKGVSEYEKWWQFGDFCKIVLKMSLPKANDLIRIWSKAQKLGVEPEKVDRLGWVKSMYVMKAAKTKEEAEAMIEEAEGITQEQFIEKVKSQVSGSKFYSERKYRRLFLLTATERDFVDETIEYAATNIMQKDLGSEVSISEVLVFILTDWRADRERK